jgi:phage terminase large subunit-like protein
MSDLFADLGEGFAARPPDPVADWRAAARPEQLMPPLSEDWRVWLLLGGRGSGKTRSGAQALAELIADDDPAATGPGEYGIVAPTFADARTVCIEGEAGILAALGTSVAAIRRGESALVEYYHMSRGVIGLRNGHVIYADSADDGGLRIQGKNLRACWADELGLFKKWRSALG